MKFLSSSCRISTHGSKAALDSLKEYPYGEVSKYYFYVHQKKPIPLPPLKAWHGYHGNVYFEPIHVTSLKSDVPNEDLSLMPHNRTLFKSQTLDLVFKRDSFSQSKWFPDGPSKQVPHPPKTGKRQKKGKWHTIKDMTTSHGKLSVAGCQHILLHQDNRPESGIFEKILVDRKSKNFPVYQKEKICKGLAAHSTHLGHSQRPFLLVTGGKFVSPPLMSPLLRTQTQYSQSSFRLLSNSPDRLPPLEQLRASLRHIDNTRDESFHRMSPYGSRPLMMTDDLMPYIKYSPDVKAKYEKQHGY